MNNFKIKLLFFEVKNKYTVYTVTVIYKDTKKNRSFSHLAQLTREAGRTQALKSIGFILTPTTVQAGTASALIHVLLAVFTRVTRRAKTAVTIHQILLKRRARIQFFFWKKHLQITLSTEVTKVKLSLCHNHRHTFLALTLKKYYSV